MPFVEPLSEVLMEGNSTTRPVSSCVRHINHSQTLPQWSWLKHGRECPIWTEMSSQSPAEK